MKKLSSVISVFLSLSIIATVASAAEPIIIGGSDDITTYTVEHYLESHYSSESNLVLTETFEGAIGRQTYAEPKTFLGYSPTESVKQSYITPDSSTTVAIDYTMDGYESGDINCDGYVDILDSTVLQRKIAGWDKYDSSKVCIYTSDINSDGKTEALDILMLMNTLAGNNDEHSERVTVNFNTQGIVSSYELIIGSVLRDADGILSDDLQKLQFDGWYDATFTKKYTVVPNEDVTLYAKYKNYVKFSFESESYFDPLNLNRFSVVDNPSGDGKVLSGYVSNTNSFDNLNSGTLRGFNPGIYEGIDSEGLKGVNGKTYTVSFKYRYEDTKKTVCSLAIYGSSASGLGASGNKSSAFTLISTSNNNNNALPLTSTWSTFSATFKYNTDYPYFYFRFSGKAAESNTIYLDDFIVTEVAEAVLLNVHGDVTENDLTVGDALPILENINDPLTDTEFKFKGWYDSSLTTAYTSVVENVYEYYAVFEDYNVISFNKTGLFDPNNRYSGTDKKLGSIACWKRCIDPTDKNNICVNAFLSKNLNNTHFALSLYDGSTNGFKLENGIKYLVSFDYLVKTDSDINYVSGSIRGSAEDNIGISGGKSNKSSDVDYRNSGKWEKATCFFTADSSVDNSPYLIFLAQTSSVLVIPNVNLYIDNIIIRAFNDDVTFKVAKSAENITFNENGNIQYNNYYYVGKAMPSVPDYYGATFINWYDEEMVTPYIAIHKGDTEFKAKYDADIINFTNGGYFDPNNKFGASLSKFTQTASPTDANNKVLKIDLNNDGNTHHFAIADSGYNPHEGYKLTKGNTYEISFMYYAENLSDKGVDVHFRGSVIDGIGVVGNKTPSCGGKQLTVEGAWTGVTVKFTYNGELEGNQYLLFLVQDSCYSLGNKACESIVYFDDIVIKETEPQKTYDKKTIKLGGWTFGYANRTHKIVVPTYNFSYIAMLQCEELQKTIKGITTTSTEAAITRENNWVENENSINIFIGNVSGSNRDSYYKVDASKLSADDYEIRIGNGNVYINGGSTYALAMGVSEFAKLLEATESGTTLSTGTSYKGKYSEKIDSYSSADYYRPTFLEDFSGDAINEDVWNIMDIGQFNANCVNPNKQSVRSKAHTYIENDKLVINGAFDDKYYYGGMLRSHGKLEYKYGYLEVSCIIPEGAGIWTATWLTADSYDGLYSGEIDVNESYGNSKHAGFNVHKWPTSAGSAWGEKHTSEGSISTNVSYLLNNEFHTYGFLWTEDRLVATLDGSIKGTYVFNTVARYDSFSDYMSIIVSMTVGNAALDSQKKLDESGDYWNKTNKYIVDYLHIYQIDGQDIRFTPPITE